MELTFPECEKILASLPIGFYALSRVETTLDKKAETSSYNPVTNSIIISYPLIAEGCKRVSDTAYKETAVRTMLYHEVSHAILTPRIPVNDVINICEDERIETVLKDYYHDVDFKRLVYLLCDTGLPPSNPMEIFFNAVRLRKGTPEQLRLVSKFIKRYSDLTRDTRDWSNYYHACFELFKKITGVEYDGSSMPPPPSMDTMASSDKADETGGEGGKSAEEKGDKESKGKGKIDEEALKKAKGEQASADATPSHGEATKSATPTELVKKLVASVVNSHTDTSLHNALHQILINFSKKNNSGSALPTYSGIFNPRACARDDYRFFERMATVNGANSFGSLHLNLFIDRSGSFCGSEKKINTLLQSLLQLERAIPHFSFDVVTLQMNEEHLSKDRLYVKCQGGNRITKKCFDLVKELQKPNTYNYNIVLFDGDAHSDSSPSLTREVLFKPFNINNCTIISDHSNREYIEPSVYKAKVIYTRNYVQELYDNVLGILQNAFR